MKQQNNIISIKKPCHENWDKMTATQQGLHCQACAKTVVDFTTMGDDAIIRLLGQQKGKLCGRFYADQLNRPLQPTSEVKPAPFFYRMLASVLMMVGVGNADAQSIKQAAAITMADGNGNDRKNEIVVMKVSRTAGGMISGTLKDSYDNGLPGTLYLKHTGFEVNTDLTGNFNFSLPDKLLRNFMTFTAKVEGYNDVEFTVYKKELPLTKKIVLYLKKERDFIMGDTILID